MKHGARRTRSRSSSSILNQERRKRKTNHDTDTWVLTSRCQHVPKGTAELGPAWQGKRGIQENSGIRATMAGGMRRNEEKWGERKRNKEKLGGKWGAWEGMLPNNMNIISTILHVYLSKNASILPGGKYSALNQVKHTLLIMNHLNSLIGRSHFR